MMRIVGIAAFIAVAITIAGHAFSCAVGTHEACLMSQDVLGFYWIASFLFIGLPAAAMVEGVKDQKRKVRKQELDAAGVSSFLDQFTRWASSRSDISAAAVVGSFARGTATPSSDIDLVILCDSADAMLGGDWPQAFGEIESRSIEDYGALRSLRIQYRDGVEVEYGIAGRSWARLPLDPGTKRVLADGVRILHDPQQILHAATRAAVD